MQDLVRIQSRQYSLDGRRMTTVRCTRAYFVVSAEGEDCSINRPLFPYTLWIMVKIVSMPLKKHDAFLGAFLFFSKSGTVVVSLFGSRVKK
ncbi:MAG TPA: hypothetical protein DCR67_10925 [Brevibacillus sp.]|nr:hypothetical protein [Brevibacillus sp.]